MKSKLLLTLVMFLCLQGRAQEQKWLRKQGSTGSDQTAGLVAVGNGQVVATGTFDGTVTLGDKTITSSGSLDIFIAKYDSLGNCLWAKSAGGQFGEEARSIAADGFGNIYITGTFGQSGATFGHLHVGGTGLGNGYVAKYSVDGEIAWVKAITGTSSRTEPRKIVVGANDKVYVAGEFYGNIEFAGTNPLTSTQPGGWNDMFVAQFDTAGVPKWANSGGGRKEEKVRGLVTDNAGDVIVYGSYDSLTTFFGTTYYAEYQFDFSSHYDLFLAKYSASGGNMWFKSMGGNREEKSGGICFDNAGYLYLTGTFSDNFKASATVTADNRSLNSLFVLKCDAMANPLWIKYAPYPESNGFQYGADMVYSNNRIAIAGSVGFKYKAGDLVLDIGNAGENNPVLIVYDTAGTVKMASYGKGLPGRVSQGLAVAASSSRFFYGGYSNGKIQFGDTILDPPTTGTDGFIVSIAAGPPASSFVGNPSSLTASLVTLNSTELTWNGTSPEFRLLRKIGSSSVSESDGTVIYEGTAKSYSATGLVEAMPYFYTVYGKSTGNVFSSGTKKAAAATLSSRPDSIFVGALLAGDSGKFSNITGVSFDVSRATQTDGYISSYVAYNDTTARTLPPGIDSVFKTRFWRVYNNSLTGPSLSFCVKFNLAYLGPGVNTSVLTILRRTDGQQPWENLATNPAYVFTITGASMEICNLTQLGDFALAKKNNNGLDETGAARLSVFPNPAAGDISISLNHLRDLKQISIYDLNGKCVRSIPATSATRTIARDGLPAGLYIIKADAAWVKIHFID